MAFISTRTRHFATARSGIAAATWQHERNGIAAIWQTVFVRLMFGWGRQPRPIETEWGPLLISIRGYIYTPHSHSSDLTGFVIVGYSR